MKVQPVSNAPERKYPFADQTTWGMRNLLIGASIAVSSLVLACATSGDSEETTPSLPGQKSVTTNISPKPPIPGEETQVASAKSPTQSLFSSAAGDREKDSDNDGIPDVRDRCPHTKGHARYQGCPAPRRPRGRIARPRHP